MSDKWKVPQHLDERLRILIFSVGETITLTIVFLVGTLADHLLLLLIAFPAMVWFKRWASARLDVGSGPACLIYWCTLWKPSPDMPPSWQRRS